MIAKAGAGPPIVPFKQLTAELLADAITFALQPSTRDCAKELALKIKTENGPEAFAQTFNNHLPHGKLVCDLGTHLCPVWRYKQKKRTLGLSALAMAILVSENLLTYGDVKL